MTNTTTDNQPSSSAIEIIRQLQSNGVIGGEAARYLKELIEIQTKAAYSKGASDFAEKAKNILAILHYDRPSTFFAVQKALDELLSQYNNKQGAEGKE